VAVTLTIVTVSHDDSQHIAVVATGHKMNWHVLATLPLPFLVSATLPPMEKQGTVNFKFSQDTSPNLGSLRPIVAQRTARYDVVNRCGGSIVNQFIKH